MHRTHTLYDLQQHFSMAPSSLFSLNTEVWYRTIEHEPFYKLSNQDVLKVIRHRLFTDSLVFECIHRLYENPVAGHLVEGEILQAIAQHVPKSFYDSNEATKQALQEFCVMMETFDVFSFYSWEDALAKRNTSYALETIKTKLK
ncbi:hypothetical protein CQS04_08170 [Chryseomicrobium excrementi]|uniref:Uncharacterized protein n=1 Tax=Chryseomicrobium excrementi TaxID=2041346 RepID=A0A2M9F0Y4_9BACL|nr:contact-dependent growth inhibition system immunity protein [Chryseomicrobium excrementi]PJK17116.1 hypothetical protein CQS04_08170 [Chryseomicrobium excrementi]